jgi:hypothetical protein
MNTTCLLSGDHCGPASRLVLGARYVIFFVVNSKTAIKEWSLRFDRNAIRLPSGDQRGVSLSPSNSSSCSAFFLPSTDAIQMCFFAGQTTVFESGEIWRSSQPSSLQPISPSKRGSPPLTLTIQACCFGILARLRGFAEVPSLFNSVPRAYTIVLPSGDSRRLAIC